MATEKDMVEFIVEQIEGAGVITYRKMFGEYALYSDGKVFALVCDNKLFIKPTKAGIAFITDLTEAPPYPGAKNYLLIKDEIEDSLWLSELVRLTVAELPAAKVKKKDS